MVRPQNGRRAATAGPPTRPTTPRERADGAGRSARFDSRAEFAAAAALSDPLALCDRLERLPARFEYEMARQFTGKQPEQQSGQQAGQRPESTGTATISGELAAARAPGGAPEELPADRTSGSRSRTGQDGRDPRAAASVHSAAPAHSAAPEASWTPGGGPGEAPLSASSPQAPSPSEVTGWIGPPAVPADSEQPRERREAESSRPRAELAGSLLDEGERFPEEDAAGVPAATAPEEDETPTGPIGTSEELLGPEEGAHAAPAAPAEPPAGGAAPRSHPQDPPSPARGTPARAQEPGFPPGSGVSGPVVARTPQQDPGDAAGQSHPAPPAQGPPAGQGVPGGPWTPRGTPVPGGRQAPPAAPAPQEPQPPRGPQVHPAPQSPPPGGQPPAPPRPVTGPNPMPPAPAVPGPQSGTPTGPPSGPVRVPQDGRASPRQEGAAPAPAESAPAAGPPPGGQASTPDQPPADPGAADPGAVQQSRPAVQPPKYEPRPDGGFGPMGSGGWAGGGPSPRYAPRNRGQQDADQEDQESSRGNEWRSGQGVDPDDADDQPQFLMHADDPGGADFGGDRLVAPPVIGEGPAGYGGF
ncbi:MULTISPECIES: hypothetical protein [Actinopolyspora]|uniref:Uncharacterized protein n=1 Tax=Actinopolyspora saharensis TaxID=995062 RepID=A0A1H1F0G7_9ACTN|nr:MULTISPECIES: hypothetical protein [Actinopolyspora]NHE77016.1 hypothetical protein [Actinopolyspora sp. BKK1]SDQ94388.1 hypothetical protein SAMN04489718_2770 [Actinopolyspora saharensis]